MPTFRFYARRGLVSRSWLVCLALSGVLVFAVVGADADGPPAGLSSEAWAGIQKQLEVERHRVVKSDRHGRLWRADNPAQRFTAHFGSEDIALVPRGGGEPGWELGLQLTSWGAANDLQPVDYATVTVEENRVEYRRGPLTEWYVNTTMGLEQGFTIDFPPTDDIDYLVLEMTRDGGLAAQLAHGASSVTFRHEASGVTLTYAGLAAWDAFGTPLEARMELDAGSTKLRLVVGVIDAAWPITVDPIFSQVAKLLPTLELDTSDANFGRSVAVDGDLMVVGMHDTEHGEEAGAIHIFHREQSDPGVWSHAAKITADDGAAFDQFGRSVAIDGDTVIVGSHNDDDNGSMSGSAYIFQRDHGGPGSWGQVAKITPGDGVEYDYFGYSVSISADTAAIGTPGDNKYGIDSGSGYIFQRHQGGTDSWGQVAKITPPTGMAGDFFGYSVSVDEDTAVIGTPWDDDNGSNAGSAYVFQRDHGGPDAWGQVAKLTPGDGAAGHWFGRCVSISGNTAVFGANGDDNGPYSGSAYVFQRDDDNDPAWRQVAKISPADGSENDYFGGSVAIDSETVVVGANTHGDSGAAYIFQRDHGGPGSWGQLAKITPPDGNGNDRFGRSVSINGDTAVVGAHYDDDNGVDSGSVYIFRRDYGGADAWVQVAKNPCPPVFAARERYFGLAVDIDVDVAIVGAYGDRDSNGIRSGSAYIFRRDLNGPRTWGLVARITPADGLDFPRFGNSVSIDGDIALIGADYDNDNGIESGSAYVYQRDRGGPEAWGQVKKITASDGAQGDHFGGSISVSGDTVVVGAYGDNDNGPSSGSAYVFRRNHGAPDAWGQVAKITASDGAYADFFGGSVSISGDTAIVGARGNDNSGYGSGSAYVFQRDYGGPDSWGQLVQIFPADAWGGDYFGKSVAISADTAIVGAYGDDDHGYTSGSAYIFRRDQGGFDAWGQVAKMTASDGAEDDWFGTSVDISGDIAVVGAYRHDDIVEDSGAAYVFWRDQGGFDAWGQVAKIRPSNDAYRYAFGYSVAIGGSHAIVGEPWDSETGLRSGSASVFVVSELLFLDGFETGDTSGWSVTVP